MRGGGGVVWCGVVWCGVVVWWCGVVWCGVVRCGAVRCGVAWRGVGERRREEGRMRVGVERGVRGGSGGFVVALTRACVESRRAASMHQINEVH